MSLRTRLLLGMAVVVLVLVAAAAAITRATERNLVRQVDQQLDRTVPQLGGRQRLGGEGQRPGIDPAEPGGEGRSGPPTALYVAVVDGDELAVLYRPTTTATDAGTPDLTAGEATARLGGGPFTVGSDVDELRYRAVVRSVGPAERTVVFALPLEDVDQSVRQLMAILALASLAIVAAMGLVTFWVLRLGVRPLRQMTTAATAIGEGDLSQRVPSSAPGTEADELGQALNQMLGRIEGAFDERSRSEERLRQFVADASHELRTPVTTIRGYAELYRLGGLREGEDLDEAMRRTEQEATRMGQLVSDLLDLARLDQGRPLHLTTIDLAALAADAVADARAVEPERPLELDVPGGAVLATADESAVRQIFANLLANARVHTDPTTPVAVRLRADAEHVVLEVADRGPGMAPEVAARAFERFYRADPARTRHRGGSGLGLSIVAGLAAAQGGRASLASEAGLGTTVRVELPRPVPTEVAADSR